MGDVKLSSRVLEAALADFAQRGVVRGNGGNLETLEAAARALLAVMEPASDEELTEWQHRHLGYGDGEVTVSRMAYRAAEARARRLANWSDDKPAEGSGGEG